MHPFLKTKTFKIQKIQHVLHQAVANLGITDQINGVQKNLLGKLPKKKM